MSERSQYEPTYAQELQAQALHTVFSALGGLNVFMHDGAPCITVDDIASVRRTQRHRESDGRTFLYTTNVTVSVSRVELT